jgi:hypothetical protein
MGLNLQYVFCSLTSSAVTQLIFRIARAGFLLQKRLNRQRVWFAEKVFGQIPGTFWRLVQDIL